jgi:hypothetical protein
MPFLENSIAVRTAAARTMAELKPEEMLANFEELSVLEAEFEDAETEISEDAASAQRAQLH